MDSNTGLIDRVLSYLEERKNRVLRGDINCIPLPFERFRKELPGIEQGVYYLISGLTKSAKSQITNYLFIYNSIFYAFKNPNKVRIKIFYYPLEETPESITLRFMAFLLYTLSEGKYRISPTDLKSTNENKPLSEDILKLLRSEEYQNILTFYQENVMFLSDRNPTGIYKTVKNYAKEHGTEYFKTIKINKKDEDGNTIGTMDVEAFDYYKPNDPNEYVIILTDHVSLLETERGLTLRETINKFSEYMILFRNRYRYIPVVVQQQSTETGNLEAFKAGKIRPTMAGLSDSKYTGKDCTVMLGITNPFSFELPDYIGYNINLLRGNARFLEVVLNREGQSNGMCPLYFDGAVNYFKELPKPTDTNELDRVYRYLQQLRGETSKAFLSYSSKEKVKVNLFNRIKSAIFALTFKK